MRSYKRAVKTPNTGLEKLTPGQGTRQMGPEPTRPSPTPSRQALSASGKANVAQGGSGTIQRGLSRTNMGRKKL